MESLIISSSSLSSITPLSSLFNSRCLRKFRFAQPLSFTISGNAMSRRQAVSCNAAQSAEKMKENKLWGGRFEESVTDVVERFTESISFDKQLYKQDIQGSRAHASMLAKQGLMSESDRDCILQGLSQIEKQIEAGEFDWRTDREDVHMNIETTLTDLQRSCIQLGVGMTKYQLIFGCGAEMPLILFVVVSIFFKLN